MTEPRIVADVYVQGSGYDDLVAQARRRAEELLGTSRDYWLDLQDAGPAAITTDGMVLLWQATARIVAPHDPAF